MIIDNVFELVVIGLALTYSRASRLSVMVITNILAYSIVQLYLENKFDVYASPGYEIYYMAGGVYFLIMGALFAAMRDKYYSVIALVLFVQAIASGSMIINDSLHTWHEAINDKALFIECIIVWISTIGRPSNGESQ